ncbi:hypothetical protein E2C01_059909 [Portunus trituberculatus]|uniref:Uncharacterized protein n=1 Tax=Portunus trituberculatus TaxID=210409 RepID=A0A5B7H6N8_PORTR|nr:hypothetical protein [Portunus trituberculatus]
MLVCVLRVFCACLESPPPPRRLRPPPLPPLFILSNPASLSSS